MPTLNEHADFSEILQLTGEELRLLPDIIEKDYWVTRILRAIAEEPSLQGRAVFKGGTSLSKGWELIQRFSEDVDILLVESEHREHGSGARRRDRLRQVRRLIARHTPFSEFGDRDSEDDDRDSFVNTDQVLKVRYPISTQLATEPSTALTEGVLLEVGFRGGSWPTETVQINSIVGSHIQTDDGDVPDELADFRHDLTEFPMELLDPVRTFAEKLLAIHCKYDADAIEERVRDYYDITCLFESYPRVGQVVGTAEFDEILVRAAETSERHFGAELDPNDLPLKRSEAFRPPPERREDLSRAYAREADLYYEGQPPFDRLMTVAATIQDAL